MVVVLTASVVDVDVASAVVVVGNNVLVVGSWTFTCSC